MQGFGKVFQRGPSLLLDGQALGSRSHLSLVVPQYQVHFFSSALQLLIRVMGWPVCWMTRASKNFFPPGATSNTGRWTLESLNNVCGGPKTRVLPDSPTG